MSAALIARMVQPPVKKDYKEEDFKISENAKILVVDDNPLNVRLLTKLLDQCGYKNVISTTDPKEAVTLCNKHGFDAVLLDVNMPVMNGFEVLRAIRQFVKNPTPLVIMVTAQNDDATKLRCASLGAFGFIPKPLSQTETQKIIHASYCKLHKIA